MPASSRRISWSRPSASAAAADAAHEHRGVVARRETAEDVVAEAGRADRRRERRGAHHPDRRRAHARDDHRQRERQLDAPELLARRHADAARGFAHRGIDAREAGHRVAQDRQQAVERERDQRGQGADPAHVDPAAREQRADPREQRHHHREQRETRDGLDRARGAEQRRLERGAAVDGDAERDRDQRARRRARRATARDGPTGSRAGAAAAPS